MRPAGVVFDFDGVLVDSEGLWYRAYSQVLAEFGVTVSREDYAREWVSLGRGPEIAVERFGLPVTPDELRRRRTPLVEKLVLEDGVPMPGVREALERLGARYPLAVATNSWERVVRGFLEKHGLAGAFGGRLVTKECYPRAKPAPDAYLAAAAALGLPPERCVVIEDAEKGAFAAHAAGARCVAVPNWWTEEGDLSTADRIVGALDEVTPDLVATVLEEPPVVIRPATEADRAAICAVHLASIRELAARAYSADQVAAWTEGRTPEGVQLARDVFLVAEDAAGVAGFGAVSVAGREVDAVYVHPRRAGRGVGARLLCGVERVLREAGVAEAELSSSLNAAAFYARHGWSRLRDERHRFPSGADLPCVRMGKRLRR
jgi:HAD superfamily hydrolase (TIGR01509 family)